jgi:hypothetical protein
MQPRTSRSRHPFAGKLSLADAVSIRARHAAGESARGLAAKYAVAPASIYALLRGDSHACVIAVQLSDSTYKRLLAVAKSTRQSVTDCLGVLITGALGRGSRSSL